MIIRNKIDRTTGEVSDYNAGKYISFEMLPVAEADPGNEDDLDEYEELEEDEDFEDPEDDNDSEFKKSLDTEFPLSGGETEE